MKIGEYHAEVEQIMSSHGVSWDQAVDLMLLSLSVQICTSLETIGGGLGELVQEATLTRIEHAKFRADRTKLTNALLDFTGEAAAEIPLAPVPDTGKPPGEQMAGPMTLRALIEAIRTSAALLDLEQITAGDNHQRQRLHHIVDLCSQLWEDMPLIAPKKNSKIL